jgi:Ca-activated chloride channel family protein
MRSFSGFLLAALLLAQDAPPTFRSDVNLVTVAFTARDARGRLVTHLTRDDIEIFEDGRPQKIQLFARHADLPLTIGLVVDASGSQAEFVRDHRRDIRTFLERVMRPGDRVFLVGFRGRVVLLEDFTAETKNIATALEEYLGKRRGPRLFPELGPPEIRPGGSAYFDAVYLAAQKLRNIESRKALVAFSDGEDNTSAHHMMEVIEEAQAAGVPVYGVRYTELQKGVWNARNKYGRGVMRRIALETGGREFDAEEESVSKAFGQIGEELRSMYEAGYATTNPKRDGLYRKVLLQPRDESIEIRAKRSYYAR